MAKLLLISGSLRGGSTNSATLRTAAALAPDGVEASRAGQRAPHSGPSVVWTKQVKDAGK